jgi:hypothetical protein
VQFGFDDAKFEEIKLPSEQASNAETDVESLDAGKRRRCGRFQAPKGEFEKLNALTSQIKVESCETRLAAGTNVDRIDDIASCPLLKFRGGDIDQQSGKAAQDDKDNESC